MELEVQTRSDGGELRFFKTVTEAFQYAEANPDIWKVSWTEHSGERVRFVRTFESWLFEPIPLFNELIENVTFNLDTKQT